MVPQAVRAAKYMATHSNAVAAHTGAAREEHFLMDAVQKRMKDQPGGLLGYAYRQTLHRVPDPQNRSEVYIYTHAVMFATDMGNVTVSSEGHLLLLDRLCVDYALDWDVLGEVLISAKCLSLTSPTLTAAYDSFDAYWTSRKFDGAFSEEYHLVVVGGILYGMN